MQNRNYTKICAIAGVVLGEVYMLYTALAPRRGGDVVPVDHTIWVVITLSIFFGAFGGFVGTGIGLIVTGLFGKTRPVSHRTETEERARK